MTRIIATALCLVLAACGPGSSLSGDASLEATPDAPVDPVVDDAVEEEADGDSDGDTILDSAEGRWEGPTDTDGDTTPDYLDLDSDCDTITDEVEAGDGDVTTPPRDTDGDGIPDFRDPDSDQDGLPDWWEADFGTDPYSEDTDMDGMTDLIEVGMGTDPRDGSGPPRPHFNNLFIMRWNDPVDPPLDPVPTLEHLVFMTDIQQADVFFAVDRSGGMAAELANLRTQLETTAIPGIRALVPDAWFGVGTYSDCVDCSGGSMAILEMMTDDTTAVVDEVRAITSCGSTEPAMQFLTAVATGDITPFAAWGGISPTAWTCSVPGSLGWPCFRPHAVPIVVHFSDEVFSESWTTCDPPRTLDQAITALSGIGARYIGINSGGTTGSAHDGMESIAIGTRSVDISGAPAVFDIASDGTGLGAQVVDAVEILAHQVPVDVTAVIRDDLTDSVDTVAEFIDRIEPSVTGGYSDPFDPTIICEAGLAVADLVEPLDGIPDSFPGILPGTAVCFDIHVKRNRTVPATDEPQVFMATVDILGSDRTVLDTRHVYFLVPPVFDVVPCDD